MPTERLTPLHGPSALARRSLCALTLMAKVPQPGCVKTRLCPPLTPEQAAALSTAFLRDTAATLAGLAAELPAAGVVSYTPPGMAPHLDPILPYTFAVLEQRGATFGERLLATAEDVFAAGFSSLCLIDADSPTVPREAYRQAVDALARGPEHRVVLGPAVDGGYYLLGLRRPEPRLFQDIDWSTGRVYTQTLDRARDLGLEVLELPPWYDVDDPASLDILRTELLAGIAPGFALLPGAPAPATAALLGEISFQHAVPRAQAPEAGGADDQPVEGAQRPLPDPLSPGEQPR